MKVSTNILEGRSLDYAVAQCNETVVQVGASGTVYTFRSDAPVVWTPSTCWPQGGPIIERERISIVDSDSGEEWNAMYRFKLVADDEYWSGPTPLIAAMRCFVATKLGDELEIPDCLLEGSC